MSRVIPIQPASTTAGEPMVGKPSWLKVRAPLSSEHRQLARLMREKQLNTVCEEASCPNIAECWKRGSATFMILGRICTRACTFCDVETGRPDPIDTEEPRHLAEAVAALGLKHVVITSVDRDDLPDGGAAHYATVIRELKERQPQVTIEVLTPDFRRKSATCLETVIGEKPDIFNHNLETVPRLYHSVRPGARYFTSLRLLQRAKELDANMVTKSGIMVGLGEERNEVLQVLDDLREADVDILTIGQYLRPGIKHHPVMKYWTPEVFEELKCLAERKGFSIVASGPLVRSSFHAEDMFQRLRIRRETKEEKSDATHD